MAWLKRPACAVKYGKYIGTRKLHLAPPFLLDGQYIPRYHLLSAVDVSKKRSEAYAHLRKCNLCPRLCGVNRYEKTGVCMIGAETAKVNVIAPHFGEGGCSPSASKRDTFPSIHRAMHPRSSWLRLGVLFGL